MRVCGLADGICNVWLFLLKKNSILEGISVWIEFFVIFILCSDSTRGYNVQDEIGGHDGIDIKAGHDGEGIVMV